MNKLPSFFADAVVVASLNDAISMLLDMGAVEEKPAVTPLFSQLSLIKERVDVFENIIREMMDLMLMESDRLIIEVPETSWLYAPACRVRDLPVQNKYLVGFLANAYQANLVLVPLNDLGLTDYNNIIYIGDADIPNIEHSCVLLELCQNVTLEMFTSSDTKLLEAGGWENPDDLV